MLGGFNINPFDPKQYTNPLWMIVVVPLFLLIVAWEIAKDTIFSWEWHWSFIKNICRVFKWWN